jgi:hypothetical protein
VFAVLRLLQQLLLHQQVRAVRVDAVGRLERRHLGEATAAVVRTNRQHPPDYIIARVEELTGGRPFAHIDAGNVKIAA